MYILFTCGRLQKWPLFSSSCVFHNVTVWYLPSRGGAHFSPPLKPSWPCEECSESTSEPVLGLDLGLKKLHMLPLTPLEACPPPVWRSLAWLASGWKTTWSTAETPSWSHLDQSAPNQPSHWPQLPMWAQPWLEGSPSPAQIVEPQNGEWINRCFKPTQFVMQQKLTDTVGKYVYRKLWMQKWYVFVFCDGKSIRLSKCEKSSNTVEAG